MSEQSELLTIPARRGRAVRLSAGEAIQIVNTHGAQVVDTWAFNAEDPTEFMSNEHMRATLGKLWPGQGDPLITNRRRAILVLEADTSPGQHDTLIAACDDYRYGLLGCADNLHAALRRIGIALSECPSPLNLWMNIPVASDGRTSWGEPLSKPGDHVVLRAQMDCIVAMSACPQDILPINGAACQPTEAHYRILPTRRWHRADWKVSFHAKSREFLSSTAGARGVLSSLSCWSFEAFRPKGQRANRC